MAHAHRESDEIHIVLEGQALIAVNDKLFNVAAGEVLCVPSGTVHQLMRVEVPHRSLVTRSPSVNDRIEDSPPGHVVGQADPILTGQPGRVSCR